MEGVAGSQLVIALVIGLAILIFLILKTKIHAFLALIVAATVIGLIAGMGTGKTVDAITGGFGGTLGSIGIIIGFGVMMGEIFQESGAAATMARTFLKICGKGKEEIALAITGFVVSIPIFCDSGYVILSPIAKAISKQTKKSVVGLGCALEMGLLATHILVPPTPGPLGVAGLFGVNVGTFILIGLVLAVPIAIAAMIYAVRLGKSIYQVPSEDGNEWVRPPYQEPDYSNVFGADTTGLPGAFVSFFPLVLPIILILLNTIFSALIKSKVVEASSFTTLVIFLGQPIIAVGLGLVAAIYTLGFRETRDKMLRFMENGIKSAGIIILVTGGGGALGRVLTNSGIGTFIAGSLANSSVPLFILPFLMATLIRFAQGSGTVAMTTSASICAPIIAAAGGNMMLGGFGACIGAFFFSYFNDSFFWVTNRLIGITDTKEQIRVASIPTTIAWAVGFVELFILSLILK